MLNPLDLSGKRILVTGASSGIGRASALMFSRLGARVALLARNEARVVETLRALEGEGHSVHVFDLSACDEIPDLVKSLASEAGPFAGLFHAAGVYLTMPIRTTRRAHIEGVMEAAFMAAMLLVRGMCHRGVRAEEGGVSLVLMSSVMSSRGHPGNAVYGASRAAVDAAVRSLACELAPSGVRVNSIVAGAVDTEMHREVNRRLTDEAMRDYQDRHLLGFGTPEDVAVAAAFLLSDAARWITGTALVVDGGYTCQ